MMQSRSRHNGRMARGPRTTSGFASLVACVALALGAVLAATPAVADSAPTPEDAADSSGIRWTAKPADGEKIDGRKRVEAAVDPGATVDEHMAVKNLSDIDATFVLSAADGVFNQNGRFDMLPADKASVDAGTWIDLPETVTVPAKQTAIVPFTIKVPSDATPGDHEAGVAASVLSEAGNLQVVSRVGFRVSISVAGELTPGLGLTVTSAEYQPSWNPFAPGSVEIRYTLENSGNVHLQAAGTAKASSLFGALSAQSEFTVENIAPGQSRDGVVVVTGIWPGFSGSAEVALTPSSPEREGAESIAAPSVDGSGGFAAIPWPQLALLLVVILIIIGVRAIVTSRRRRFESRLDEMVEERLTEAGATTRRTVGADRPSHVDTSRENGS